MLLSSRKTGQSLPPLLSDRLRPEFFTCCTVSLQNHPTAIAVAYHQQGAPTNFLSSVSRLPVNRPLARFLRILVKALLVIAKPEVNAGGVGSAAMMVGAIKELDDVFAIAPRAKFERLCYRNARVVGNPYLIGKGRIARDPDTVACSGA